MTEVTELKQRGRECSHPACKRPGLPEHGDKFPLCPLHLEVFDGFAEIDDCAMAEEVLEPWIKCCEVIGLDALTRVMCTALETLQREKVEFEERVARAEAELVGE